MNELKLILFLTFVIKSSFGAHVKSKGTNQKVEAKSAAPQDTQSYRLPDSLKPSHYLVRLRPFLYGNFSIEGYEEITLSVHKPTDKIVLHMTDIITLNDTTKVTKIDNGNNTSSVGILSQTYDPGREFYIIHLNETLVVGETYVLYLNFIGLLNDILVGFYRLTYPDEFGTQKTMAATQFQPTDARRAFPCFDEPALKATFTIGLMREDGMKSLSNMPIKDTVPLDGHPGWYLDNYETSVPMPTYLVAFSITDFDFIESNESRKYDFRVWTRSHWIDQGEYALDIGPKIMDFFEGFFNVSFPLPKTDMIAVPDMAGWAMENWGLITYREFEMLNLEEQASANHKMRISTVMAHELSHQWFGNLVTPLWWTDLWLNEGFASYMEHFGMNGVDPSLHLLELVVVRYLHYAFELDCLKQSHPISVEVGHPAEINEIFDPISYQKGASIIRMMHHFLSEETFKKGLSKYLKEKSYDNAEQDDLWLYLTNQAHEDGTLDKSLTVKEIMDTWTLQMGFPVVTVTFNQNNSITISQKRFLLYDNPIIKDGHDYKWWIPLTFASELYPDFEQTRPNNWLMPTETVKTLTNISNVDGSWVILNLKQTGYYRVNYDAQNWQAIIHQLDTDHNVIDPINRAQLLDDALALARSGDLPYSTALPLLSYMKKERNFIPIKAGLRGMTYLIDMFHPYNDTTRENDYQMIKDFFLSLLTPIYDEVGFEDSLEDPNLQQMKRSYILSWMCQLGHESCVNQSIALYDQWMTDPDNFTIISPNQKEAAYCSGISYGGDAEWNFAWDRYLNADFSKEKVWLLQAMGCSSDEKILNQFLNRTVTPDQGIRKQDLEVVVMGVSHNPLGRIVSWKFARDNWKAITQYLGENSLTLRAMMEAFTKFLHTDDHLVEFKDLKKRYEGSFGSAQRAVKQADEILQTNIRWRKNSYPEIVQWLQTADFVSF